MVRDSETGDRNAGPPTFTAEETVLEIQEKISTLVRYLSMSMTKKEALQKSADFLGISNGQVKSFVYGSAVRVDAHLYLQVTRRVDGIMADLNAAMEAFATENLRQHGLTPASWTPSPTDPEKDC